MEWTAVTTETVRNHMGVEMVAAYDKWIAAYPEKAGRLEEIVNSVRTEFRDAIAARSKNWLHPDKTYLPESAVRHCENIVQYTLGMEMGVQLTVDGRTLLTRADMYLRQIVYGHNRFADENDSDETVPSYSVPSSTGRALGNLVALLLGFFLWCLPARAAWIQEKNETTYVPVNYDITEQSLGGHLAGIDNAIGWLSDTNGLYGRLVGLPQLVYDTLDTIQAHSLYGDYRHDADAWLCLSQTNVMFQGQVMAGQLRTRKDDILGTSGDLIVDGGIELGGEYRTNWPSGGGGGGGGDYLPVTWQQIADEGIVPGTAVVLSNVVFKGTFRVWGPSGYFDAPIYVEDADWNHLPWIDTQYLKFGGVARTNWPSGLSTARVSATDTSVVAGDYIIWLDTRGFTASQSVTLTLPDMDGDAQTVVVRRLGNDGAAYYVRGTNTFELTYEGDGITADWLKAATNWFWRTF